MPWKPGETAKAFGISKQLLTTLAWEFKDYLSPGANPGKGLNKHYTEDDISVLAYIYNYWEDDPDISSIEIGLNHKEHLQDKFCSFYRMKSPIFRENFDINDWNEDLARRSLILNDSKISEPKLIAQAYRCACETLIDNALRFDEAYNLDYPIFYLHRHCLELYLKLCLDTDHSDIHSLWDCVEALELQHKKEFSEEHRSWLKQFHEIDKKWETFRYADDRTKGLVGKEYWVDLSQFKCVMNSLYDGLARLYENKSPNIGLASHEAQEPVTEI